MYYIIKLNFQLLSPNKYPIYCNICAKLAETQPIFKLFHRLGYAIAYWLVGISCPKAVSLEWFSQCLFPPIIINKDINAFFIC